METMELMSAAGVVVGGAWCRLDAPRWSGTAVIEAPLPTFPDVVCEDEDEDEDEDVFGDDDDLTEDEEFEEEDEDFLEDDEDEAEEDEESDDEDDDDDEDF